MRKYWYYTYKTVSSFGSGVCWSDNGEFDILNTAEHLKNKYSVDIVIENWHEISSTQYEKLNSFYEANNK